MLKLYLVKRAMGSILSAQATHPLTQKVVPEVWDPWKQETIDKLVSELPPIHQQAPVRAGTARLTTRSRQ
jgi:hypothetical protein